MFFLQYVLFAKRPCKYVYNKEKKRNAEKLKKVETFTAGRLLEAARLIKERHDILIHLEGAGRDLPAIKPRYHHSCCMDLTRFLSKPHKEAAVNTLPYEKAYDTFCTSIVVPKIIEAKKILLLTSLRKSFIKIIKEVEGVDTSYRSADLKNRLAKSFPQLQFTLARPLGYVVYSGAVNSASDLLKSAFDEMSSDQDSQESHDGVQADYTSPTTTKTEHEVLRTNYMSAKIVMSAVENSVSKFSTPWPPTAKNLNVDIAKSLVPHQLFNWIAWTTGLNDDPQADTYATVETTEEKKILSIAQKYYVSPCKR